LVIRTVAIDRKEPQMAAWSYDAATRGMPPAGSPDRGRREHKHWIINSLDGLEPVEETPLRFPFLADFEDSNGLTPGDYASREGNLV
jgi:hypothetical protein